MHDADEVWNRALDHETELTAPGDRTLRDVLVFDGSVENGGLLNAVESFEDDEEFPLDRVVEGYRYLGMERTATLVGACRDQRRATADDAVDDLEALELAFDPQHPVAGEDLAEALAARLAAAPRDFAPTH